jgi:hypothetical protein
VNPDGSPHHDDSLAYSLGVWFHDHGDHTCANMTMQRILGFTPLLYLRMFVHLVTELVHSLLTGPC